MSYRIVARPIFYGSPYYYKGSGIWVGHLRRDYLTLKDRRKAVAIAEAIIQEKDLGNNRIVGVEQAP